MTLLWLRLRELSRQFWFLPSVMVLAALLLAWGGINLEERYGVPESLALIYGGGDAGARSVLVAVASSSIGVAGTVFSVTIAALAFAAGNMGPRLLDNFTRDRGNQLTLGTFIASFAFCLYTLRVVQGGEAAFVPHYNVTLAFGLGLACVGVLVYFIFHVTASINMTHVLNLLRDDLAHALREVTREEAGETVALPPDTFWQEAEALHAPQGGYLQLLDTEALLHAAGRAGVAVRLLVRPGEYIFPNTVIALGVPRLPPGVLDTLSLGAHRTTDQDVEYAVRQMSEIAARALSPGVNDPVTAIDVLDRFGDALCRLQGRHWPGGLHVRHGQVRLLRPVTDFAGLTDEMFRMIRQYGRGTPAVMIRLLEVLTAAATCLRGHEEQAALRQQAELTRQDALRHIENPQDREDLEQRYRRFQEVLHAPDASRPSVILPAEEREKEQEGGMLAAQE